MDSDRNFIWKEIRGGFFNSQTSFSISLKQEIHFCFQIAYLVLSLYFNFDEHQYEAARSRIDWQTAFSPPPPPMNSFAACVSNSKQRQFWNSLWNRISLCSTPLSLDISFTNGRWNVWTHLESISYWIFFLANDFPVSRYIALPWSLLGILILEETPQSPTAREIIWFKTCGVKVSSGTLILRQ